MYIAHAHRIGDENGPVKRAELVEPVRAGDLAITVEAEARGVHTVGALATAWMDGCYAGADGALSDHQFALTPDERGVADRDAGDIRDCVVRARLAMERNAEVTRTGFVFSENAACQEEDSNHDPPAHRFTPESFEKHAMGRDGWLLRAIPDVSAISPTKSRQTVRRRVVREPSL